VTDLRILPIQGSRDLKRFLEMPGPLYRTDPLWVPPLLLERRDHLDPRKNPFLRGIEMAYWMAFRGDRCVGRISAQVNRKHLDRHHDDTGHFGFLEAEDDALVFAGLMAAAEGWLRAKGMHRIAGPFNPSINDECGLLIEGFDTGPSMMMGHNPPYYPARVEEQGFVKAKDLIAYWSDLRAGLPPMAMRVMERLKRMDRIRIRPLDKKRFHEDIGIICDIFNDAWADNWGFIPFGQDEAQYLAKSIRPLVGPEWFAIGEIDGEPASMVVTLPNLNTAIKDLDGRLLPFGWAKLLWRLKVRGVADGRMPLMGVRKKYQGTAKGAALAMGVIGRTYEYHRAHGRTGAELSWVLEDNQAMRDMLTAVGAKPYKTYRIYQKQLA
jgi:hypothetical protein